MSHARDQRRVRAHVRSSSSTSTAILGDVRARPSGAELFVDSVSKGSAEQTLRLPATAHVIEIRKQGYAPYRTTVTPRPNLPQNIDVTLLEGVAATAASAPLANNPGGAATTGPQPRHPRSSP